MNDSNIILYSPGAYGNFINWCCDYFSNITTSYEPPLDDKGSCHSYENIKIWKSPPDFKNYTESTHQKKQKFLQIHEDQFDIDDRSLEYFAMVDKNLAYLQKNYNKSIFVYPTQTSKLWATNNWLYKIKIQNRVPEDISAIEQKLILDELSQQFIDILKCDGIEKRILKILDFDFPKESLKNWGHDSIYDFDRWELRELLSFYYYCKINSHILLDEQIFLLQKKYHTTKFIRLDDLRDNFKITIKNILDHFEVLVGSNWNNIHTIHSKWANKQIHMNKDYQVSEIVNTFMIDKFLDWSTWQLNILDEALIQQKLVEHGLKMKWYGVNIFPSTTDQLKKLL